jgi:enolase-phosphatase E1
MTAQATAQRVQAPAELILLDIEGTVSPLAYVHTKMFPFARARLGDFLASNLARPDVTAALTQVATDATGTGLVLPPPTAANLPVIIAHLNELMDRDVKATGLKQLQGLIWEGGFRSGELRADLFPDVAPALRAWHAAGVELQVYSSGSNHAQKLFFAHTVDGDLTPLLAGHHDTTVGPKKAAASYAAIAAASGRAPEAILFLSDIVAELDAARAAGLRTALALRPDNPPAPAHDHPVFSSLLELTP